MRFIYLGYCEVEQAKVHSFLDLARDLEVAGLTQEMEEEKPTNLGLDQEEPTNLDIETQPDVNETTCFNYSNSVKEGDESANENKLEKKHPNGSRSFREGTRKFYEWQESWMTMEDKNGDLYGEYLSQVDDKYAR